MKLTNVSLENLGTVNKNKVILTFEGGARVELYFSYKTIVGVYGNGIEACIQNYWSTTTGKLLNEIEPDKNKRLSQDDFDKELSKVFEEVKK
ncbi:MAG: hypothetical protein H6743_03940 [Rickettsiaceae bacterium]|nr:hypothetical protein [Rickettsiaceae bacterium]